MALKLREAVEKLSSAISKYEVIIEKETYKIFTLILTPFYSFPSECTFIAPQESIAQLKLSSHISSSVETLS